MKKTLVVLQIRDDDDARDWWEVLGLPSPERINTKLEDAGIHAYVRLHVEAQIV